MVGKYRHYKGGLYEVLFVAIHTETKERLVIYESLKDGQIWARPYEMFFENVEYKGKIMPRFEKIKEN